MQYHIIFSDEQRLTFELIDNPVTRAWVDIVKKKLEEPDNSSKVYRHTPPEPYPLNWFYKVKVYHERLKQLGFEIDFDLEQNIYTYSDQDFYELDKNVERLFNKAVINNVYYKDDPHKVRMWKDNIELMKRHKEELLDFKFNPSEYYAWIKPDDYKSDQVLITDEMRKQYWVENARSNVVLRLQSSFDTMTLDAAERRKDKKAFVDNVKSHMTHISFDHKICYYKTELTQEEAQKYMRHRREDMLNFVLDNNINAIPGELHNFYFVNPVIGHCIDKDITEEDILKMFSTYEKVKIEFGE